MLFNILRASVLENIEYCTITVSFNSILITSGVSIELYSYINFKSELYSSRICITLVQNVVYSMAYDLLGTPLGGYLLFICIFSS